MGRRVERVRVLAEIDVEIDDADVVMMYVVGEGTVERAARALVQYVLAGGSTAQWEVDRLGPAGGTLNAWVCPVCQAPHKVWGCDIPEEVGMSTTTLTCDWCGSSVVLDLIARTSTFQVRHGYMDANGDFTQGNPDEDNDPDDGDD